MGKKSRKEKSSSSDSSPHKLQERNHQQQQLHHNNKEDITPIDEVTIKPVVTTGCKQFSRTGPLCVIFWFLLVVAITCCSYQRLAYIGNSSAIPDSVRKFATFLVDYTGFSRFYTIYWWDSVIKPVYNSLLSSNITTNWFGISVSGDTYHSIGVNSVIISEDESTDTVADKKEKTVSNDKAKGKITEHETEITSKGEEGVSIDDGANINSGHDTMVAEDDKVLKKILLWTGFFGHADFEFGFGREPFVSKGCEETRCVVTNDRKQYKYSDVVLFHMREVRDRYMPTKPRPHNQRWAFVLKESPWNSWVHQFKAMKSVFNWTITYRSDSDIVWQYGTFRPLTHVSDQVTSSQQQQQLINKNYAAGKSKMAAWFTSRCPRVSERDEYTAELARFVTVDIYGRCGKLTCPGDSCYHLLNTTYKFYLAFENSICRDYVTERVFRTCQFDVVPVVLGGGDYSQVLPPHSYIDVRDFPSPRHLARYLKYLDKNDTAYNEYFKWKLEYESINLNADYKQQMFCDLCHKLWSTGDDEPPTHYDDIQAWWTRDRDCEGGIFDHLRDIHGLEPH